MAGKKRNWPPGIIKVRVCYKCNDRELVVIERNKRTVKVCSHDATCPDSKKFSKDWWIRYKLPNGKDIKEKVGPSLLKAKKALASRRGDLVQGKFKIEDVRPNSEHSMTLEKLALEKYLPYKKNRKSYKHEERRIKKHVIRLLGEVRLQDITRFTIDSYKLKRCEEINPKTGEPYKGPTINRELSAIRMMLKLAVKWGLIGKNPAEGGKEGVEFYGENQRERYFTIEELNRLLEVCQSRPPRIKAIVLAGFLTGLRKSELLSLRWSDIDTKNRVITIYGKFNKNGKPKTAFFDPMLTDILEDIKIEGCDWVFPSPVKKGNHLKDPRYLWKKVLKEAGLDGIKDGEKLVIHSLRHSFGSHLAMSGVTDKTIKELGGWKSNAYERYLHLSPGHKQEAAQKFGNLLRGGKYVESEESGHSDESKEVA